MFRFSGAGDGAAGKGPGSQIERAALLSGIDKIGVRESPNGHALPRKRVQPEQLVRFGRGQRLQQHSIDYGEHYGSRTDTQGKG
jgi:hypothetical protein